MYDSYLRPLLVISIDTLLPTCLRLVQAVCRIISTDQHGNGGLVPVTDVGRIARTIHLTVHAHELMDHLHFEIGDVRNRSEFRIHFCNVSVDDADRSFSRSSPLHVGRTSIVHVRTRAFPRVVPIEPTWRARDEPCCY